MIRLSSISTSSLALFKPSLDSGYTRGELDLRSKVGVKGIVNLEKKGDRKDVAEKRVMKGENILKNVSVNI